MYLCAANKGVNFRLILREGDFFLVTLLPFQHCFKGDQKGAAHQKSASSAHKHCLKSSGVQQDHVGERRARKRRQRLENHVEAETVCQVFQTEQFHENQRS